MRPPRRYAFQLLPLALLASALGVLTGCSTGDSATKLTRELLTLPKEEAYARGEQLVKKKKYELGRQYLRFVAENYANDPIGKQAALRLADSYFDRGDAPQLSRSAAAVQGLPQPLPLQPEGGLCPVPAGPDGRQGGRKAGPRADQHPARRVELPGADPRLPRFPVHHRGAHAPPPDPEPPRRARIRRRPLLQPEEVVSRGEGALRGDRQRLSGLHKDRPGPLRARTVAAKAGKRGRGPFRLGSPSEGPSRERIREENPRLERSKNGHHFGHFDQIVPDRVT